MPNNLFESTSSTPSTSILSHATTAQSKILNLLEALTVQIKRLEDSAKVEEETTNETVAAMRRDLEGAQAKIAALQDELGEA
jgi:predicted  nucleic acid-binding Zn-ribbon protein